MAQFRPVTSALTNKRSLQYSTNKGKCINAYVIGHSPLGLFQDQCKQTMINKLNEVKNPNRREAYQLAIYKRGREVELGATENNIS